MLCKYVLLLVTLITPTEYYITPMTDADSMEECHQKSILVDQNIDRKINQEMLCVKMDCEYGL